MLPNCLLKTGSPDSLCHISVFNVIRFIYKTTLCVDYCYQNHSKKNKKQKKKTTLHTTIAPQKLH